MISASIQGDKEQGTYFKLEWQEEGSVQSVMVKVDYMDNPEQFARLVNYGVEEIERKKTKKMK